MTLSSRSGHKVFKLFLITVLILIPQGPTFNDNFTPVTISVKAKFFVFVQTKGDHSVFDAKSLI